jgi:hypothetical protein
MQEHFKPSWSAGGILLLVCFAGLFVLHGWRAVAWFICFLSVIYCTIIVHEFAHAAVGRALGMHVHSVTIGNGPRIGSWRLWDGVVVLCLIPLGGRTFASHTETRSFRLRHCLHSLAGPVSSLALCVGIFPLFLAANEQLDVRHDDPFSVTGLLAATLGVLALTGLGCLIPFRLRAGGQQQWSDGFHVRWALTLRIHEIENQVASYYVRRANQTEGECSPNAAQEWHDLGLRRVPNSEPLIMEYVAFLCRNGGLAEAQKLATELLARPAHDSAQLVRRLDALACVPLYYPCPRLLPLADECSRRALELAPSDVTLKGTRGGVLVELGRIAEGKALLEECLDHSQSATDRAISASFLALAALREGNRERAEELQAQAERIIASESSVVDKVFRKVKLEMDKAAPTASSPPSA